MSDRSVFHFPSEYPEHCLSSMLIWPQICRIKGWTRCGSTSEFRKLFRCGLHFV